MLHCSCITTIFLGCRCPQWPWRTLCSDDDEFGIITVNCYHHSRNGWQALRSRSNDLFLAKIRIPIFRLILLHVNTIVFICKANNAVCWRDLLFWFKNVVISKDEHSRFETFSCVPWGRYCTDTALCFADPTFSNPADGQDLCILNPWWKGRIAYVDGIYRNFKVTNRHFCTSSCFI